MEERKREWVQNFTISVVWMQCIGHHNKSHRGSFPLPQHAKLNLKEKKWCSYLADFGTPKSQFHQPTVLPYKSTTIVYIPKIDALHCCFLFLIQHSTVPNTPRVMTLKSEVTLSVLFFLNLSLHQK